MVSTSGERTPTGETLTPPADEGPVERVEPSFAQIKASIRRQLEDSPAEIIVAYNEFLRRRKERQHG